MDRDVTERLAAAASATSLEQLTRPLLELLEEVTGLETTYLTRVDEKAGEQIIVFSRNVGDIEIPEGLRVEWSDTLCKRALDQGIACVDNVPEIWGDSQAARDLKLQTYVSTPVRLPDGTLYGTLCGASAASHTLDERQQRVLRLFSRVVSDQVAREHAREAESARAAAAEERLRARARLLAMAEHELKSPLSVLIGWTLLLRSRPDAGLEETALTAMVSAVETMQTQLDRMLDEAKAEVIARELDLVDLDLEHELGSTVQQLAATHPGDRFERSLTSVRVRADRHALYQVASHLIENAVKYSPEGTRVVIACGEDEGGPWFSVRDHGPGIPEGVDIFEPFQRGDTETRGVGLGLHIVRTLSEAMGASVTARRNDDVGSTFEIRFPGS